MFPDTSTINLDYHAARHAQAALANVNAGNATDMNTVATNALGVLQEMGVYSAFLYLFALRKNDHKPHALALRREMLALIGALGLFDLEAAPLPAPTNPQATLGYITTHVTADLARLFMVRQVLEQMLIYARYGAAALKADVAGGGAP